MNLIGFGGTIVVFLLWFLGNGWNEAGDDDNFQSGLDPKENLLVAARVLTWVLRLFPSFCLGNGLFYAINLGSNGQFVKGGDISSVWHESVLLYEVLFLAAQSILYLLLAIQLDKYISCPKTRAKWHGVLRMISGRFLVSPEVLATYATGEDEDVIKEQHRVEGGEANSDLVVMKNLTKRYGNGKLAVNNLSLGIPAGECFGLLGINGAG